MNKFFCFLGFCGFTTFLWGGVRINEFCADNGSGLTSAGTNFVDWIELYNEDAQSVDLSGWYLTDKSSVLTTWRFPNGTSIASNGYLIVYADSVTNSVANELHANFSLDKEGEYLALVRPDGVTIEQAYDPAEQLEDITYGLGMREYGLMDATTAGRYRVPNAGDTASWVAATGGVGFASAQSGFTVDYVEFRSNILSLANAQLMLANSALYWKTDRTYPVRGTYSTINFHGSGTSPSGLFAGDTQFPAQTINQDKNHFAIIASGGIYVPSPGLWTFAVMSDDGFRLNISGHNQNFQIEVTGGRSPSATLGTFNFPVAGIYKLDLIYFEMTGGAMVELGVAQGNPSAYNTTDFMLVGDPACPVLHAGAFGSYATTDVGAALTNINSRIDVEWPFSLEETPRAEDHVTCWIRYSDGFQLSVNGTLVAQRNAPASLAWNSTATAARSLAEIMVEEAIEVPVNLLQAGSNILSVVGLNASVSDGDFLVAPRLIYREGHLHPLYFKTPTPGAANTEKGYGPPTASIAMSEPRGYRQSAFDVTLHAEKTNRVIRYTLDGSTPSETTGFLYTNAIRIASTATLRALSIEKDAVFNRVETRSWFFLEDVLTQPTNAPAAWPTNAVNGQVFEYGMLQSSVVAEPTRIRTGFTNEIPTISLVTDLKHLVDAQTGIYVNPNNDGIAWERPVSVELIDPRRGSNYEFQVNAGLRIRGAASRTTGNPKHSFRLFFRSEYGHSKLEFPLFENEGVDRFDKVDLKCTQNYSWAYGNSTAETFIREVFSRDTQGAMGQPYTRSRYYHVYINGVYWGLYETQERGEAKYAASYLGGVDEDWDTVKTVMPSRATEAVDGTIDRFTQLWDISMNQGYSGSAATNYYRVQGRNPDGSRNPSYPVYLDETNLLVRMLIFHYTGDPDSPISAWGGFPNNMYALINRVNPEGFKWLCHDAEHSLGSNGSYPVTCNILKLGTNFQGVAKFNPSTLHHQLVSNDTYRLHFADQVQKHLIDRRGALSYTANCTRWARRMSMIDNAVTCEAARWGRGKTRATWQSACAFVTNTYFAQRSAILLGQYREIGWFPRVEAPSVLETNTYFTSGAWLHIRATNTFFYTMDGSDPRNEDGTTNRAAIVVSQQSSGETLIPRGAVWCYFDEGTTPSTNNGSAWFEWAYNASSWLQGPAILGFAGSNGNTVSTTTRRYFAGTSTQITTTYLRKTFTVSDKLMVPYLSANVLYDDGVIFYLNGVEVLRLNMPTGAVTAATYASSTISPPAQTTYTNVTFSASALRNGENVLAVELHQCNAVSTDLYFDLQLTSSATTTNAYITRIVAQSNQVVKARSTTSSEWSALLDYALQMEPPPPPDYAKLRIARLMYAPPAPAGIEPAPYKEDTYAFVELVNRDSVPMDLGGVSFYGITCTLTNFSLMPNARVIVAKAPTVFTNRYTRCPWPVLTGWSSGNLARNGENIILYAPDKRAILNFTYSSAWYPETKNTGYCLEALDLDATNTAWNTKDNWVAGNPPYQIDYTKLRVSKLMYAPTSPSADELVQVQGTVNDDYAWMEFVNAGTGTLDLAGVSISNSVTHLFAPLPLPPLARIVVAHNAAAYHVRYPSNTLPVVQWTSGSLSRSGERTYLLAPNKTPIIDFAYADSWYPETKNTGYWLESVNLFASPLAWDSAANWRASIPSMYQDYANLRITKILYGAALPSAAELLINPTLTASQFNWLELYNVGSNPIELAGVSITNLAYRFASAYRLEPQQRLLIVRDAGALGLRHDLSSVVYVQWAGCVLPAAGQTFVLTSPAGTIVHVAAYADWYNLAGTGQSLVARDVALDPLDAGWTRSDHWRVSGTQVTPGCAEQPRLEQVVVTSSAGETGRISFQVEQLDGLELTVYYSEDMQTWRRCPEAALSRTGAAIDVDLSSTALKGKKAGFFKVEQK